MTTAFQHPAPNITTAPTNGNGFGSQCGVENIPDVQPGRNEDAAHRTFVQSLEQLAEVHVLAVIGYSVRAADASDDCWFSRLSQSDAFALRQLRGLCAKAAESNQHVHRRLVSPSWSLVAFSLPGRHFAGQSIGLIVDEAKSADAWFGHIVGLVDRYQTQHLQQQLDQQSAITRHTAATIELVTEMLQTSDKQLLNEVLVRRLSDHLQVPRVALGLVQRSGQCRLVAVSGSQTVDPSAAVTGELETRMHEVLNVDPGARKSGRRGCEYRIANNAVHRDCPRQVAIPLLDAMGNPVAVLIVDVSADADEGSISTFLEASAPALASAMCVSRASRAATAAARMLQPATRRPMIALLCGFVVFLAAMCCPVRYRATFPADLEPSIKRFVAAPFDATLLECRVSPGDVVEAGDVLAVLDGRDLRLRRDSVRADYERAVKKRDAAQASRQYGQHRLAQLDVDRLRLELEMIENQLQDLIRTSPIDGVIVSGDLERVRGMPLETGQTLFEVAPMGRMTFEIAVPDSDIAMVEQGRQARLRLSAFPERQWQTVVERIHPRSELRNRQNVFIAECSIDGHDVPLRPGMKGHAKLDCGIQTLGWILFRKPIDMVRQWTGW